MFYSQIDYFIDDRDPIIDVEIGRKHPHVLYDGAAETYEDIADIEPRKIVYGTVIA